MKEIIRTYVRSAYDLQKLRIQMGNRIVAAFKHRIGQEPGMSEEQLEAWAQDLLEKLRAQYKLLAQAMPRKIANFQGTDLITTYAEFGLLEQYAKMEEQEADHFKKLEGLLNDVPIWTQFLTGIRGVGPAIGGVIVSEVDIGICTYPSSLWKYAGLDVVQVPDTEGQGYRTEGRSRKAHHLIDRPYTPKDWKEGQDMPTRKSITFNPFLKTKLIGVLGSSFLKASRILVDGKNMSSARRLELAKSLGYVVPDKAKPDEIREPVMQYLRDRGHTVVLDESPYRRMYDQYKMRLDNSPQHKSKTKSHKHNMAIRYMIKRFLVDLYSNWRKLEGLPVATEYSEGVLGMVHGEVKKAA